MLNYFKEKICLRRWGKKIVKHYFFKKFIFTWKQNIFAICFSQKFLFSIPYLYFKVKMFACQLKFLVRTNICVFLCLECKFHRGFLKFILNLDKSKRYIYIVTLGIKMLISIFWKTTNVVMFLVLFTDIQHSR